MDFLPPVPPIRWFFRQVSDNTEVGPISEDRFIDIIKNISLSAETPVRQEYSQNWEPLSQSELWAKISHINQLSSTEPKVSSDREDDNQGTRPCPYCASPIKTMAIYCRYCLRYLNEENPSKDNKSDSTEAIPTESGTIPISEKSETTNTETMKSNQLSGIASSVEGLMSEISSSDSPIVDFYKKIKN